MALALMPTVRMADGALVDLPENPTPELKAKVKAKNDAILASQARQRTVKREFAAATPSEKPDETKGFLRSLPATSGAIKGAQLGYEAGEAAAPFLGPFGFAAPVVGGALGAGGGAALGEGGLGLGQRAVGSPEGRAPILPRMESAGKTGILADLGGRALGAAGGKVLSSIGNLGRRARSLLGKTEEFGIPVGLGEEKAAGFASTRGASGVVSRAALQQSQGIADAGKQIVGQIGAREENAEFIRQARTQMEGWVTKATRLIRGMAKNRSIPGAQMDQLVQALGLPPGTDILKLMKQDVRVAEVAQTLANVPGGAEALTNAALQGLPANQRIPNNGSLEVGRRWLSGVLTGATGQEGLRKGMIDPQVVIKQFNNLGAHGQRIYFGEALPTVQRFMDALGQAGVSAAGGGTPRPIPWSKLLGTLGLGEAVGRFMGPGRALEAAAAGAVGYSIPIIGANLVSRALTNPAATPRMSTLFGGPAMQAVERGVPSLIRGATQAGAQAAQPNPQAPPQ